MYEWDRRYYGIGLTFEPKIIRVANDNALRYYLNRYGRRGAARLAAFARKMYQLKYGRHIKITARSLAAEIYDHFKLMEMANAAEKAVGQTRPTQWMIRHMDVIDCGERTVDNNRFVWDAFSVLW